MLHSTRHKLPHNRQSEAIQIRKNRRVTLIAAFKCDQGVVICADSQETVDIPGRGSFRVSVDKIKPQLAGEYEVALGGAGDAHLVDGFTRKLLAEIARWPPLLEDEAIEERITALSLDYHSTHVAATAASRPPDPLDFLLCLKRKDDPNIILWELRDTLVIPTDTYSLVGLEEPIYEREVSWLYRDDLRIAQAVLLSIRLLAMAKSTSNFIGGNTTLIVVNEGGMEVLDQEQVNTLEERIETFNDALAQLVLDLPDTSIQQSDFRESLRSFQRLVMQVREFYLGQLVGRSLYRAIFDPNWKGDTAKQLPSGTVIERTEEQGRPVLTFSHKIEELEELDEPND